VDKQEWQGSSGDAWAAQWRRTDRSFTALTEKLLSRLRGLAFAQVLDVGCGAGELALAIARGRSDVRVTGVDVSTALVAAARDRASHLANLAFDCADAAHWTAPVGGAPQLLVSRHGVMFFTDPPAAFAHLRAIAAPGAHFVFSCFRTPRENPWASEIAAMLPASLVATPPDPHAPGPFAFAQPDHVRAILSAAGWQDIAFEPFDYAYIAGMGDDPVADAAAFFSQIGPAAMAMRQLPEAERGALKASLIDWLAVYRDGNLVVFPAAAWIVSARNG